MRRLRPVLLLLVLAALALVAVRAVRGPERPAGTVALRDVRGDRLERRSFALDAPATVVVEATGSVGATDSLEAHAWLLDAATRRVVWRMRPARARRLRGTLVHARDTLALGPGRYALFFTPLGRTPGDDGPLARATDPARRWRNDAPEWGASVRALDGPPPRPVAEDAAGAPPSAPVAFRVDDGADWSGLVDVATAGRLRLRLTGYGLGAATTLDVLRLADSVVVRALTPADVRPAGGAPGFGTAALDVPLGPGLHAVRYRVGPAARRVRGRINPPLDPDALGLSVVGEGAGVRRFDPFGYRRPFLSLGGPSAGGSPNRPVQALHFATDRPLHLYVAATMRPSAGASITRDDTDAEVWRLDRRTTRPVPGGYVEGDGFLTLPAGRYALRFDGFIGPSGAPPRYGVHLFKLDRGAVRVSGVDTLTPPRPARPDGLPDEADALAALTRVGNNERHQARFRVPAATPVRVYALGEWVGGEMRDGAWLTGADGATVWTMAYENTAPAGGRDGFRVADEVLTLPAGAYTLHYRTDGARAYGDFRTGRPTYPERWGAVVVPVR